MVCADHARAVRGGRYFRRVLAAAGRTLDADTPMVLERFEVRYPPRRRTAATGDGAVDI